MKTKISHIGVLTEAAIAPIKCSNKGGYQMRHPEYGLEVVGFMNGFRGLVENDYMPLDLKTVSGISHTGGTILGCSNRDNPFAYYSMRQGQVTQSDESERALHNLEHLALDGLIVIGGDGSLNIANRFDKLGLR